MIKIDIRLMKGIVPRLPRSVANLILQETDFIDSNEYFAKASVWLKLLQAEQAGDKND